MKIGLIDFHLLDPPRAGHTQKDQKSVIKPILQFSQVRRVDIYSSWSKNVKSGSGPTSVMLFLLGLGLFDTILRTVFGGIDHLSLQLFYTNTLLYALFFGIVLMILGLTIDERKISSLFRWLSKYFWLLGFQPMVSYLIYGEVSRTVVLAEYWSIFLLIVILTSISARKMIHKTGPVRTSIASTGMIALSLPIFNLSRVSLSIDSEVYFELYEILTLTPFLQSGWSENLLVNQQFNLIIILLLLENFVIYAVFASRFSPKKFKNIIDSIKPFRTLHFIMMVILGVLFVRNIAPDEALSLISVNHFPFIFIPALCGVCTWQFTTLLNDMYDMDIDVHVHPDRPLVSRDFDRRFYMDILISIGILSALLSLLIGLPLLILNLVAIFLAILYSVPPFRLRDRLYGHICVGLGSVIGFIFGVYSPLRWTHGIYLDASTSSRVIPFFPEVFSVAVLVVVVLSISPLINALSDYEGDKKSGVRNVYTVLGFEKGKKIVSFLLIFLFISPLILFNSTLDIIFLFSTGLVSSFMFYRLEDHRPVFGMYFLVLIYLVFRFVNYI